MSFFGRLIGRYEPKPGVPQVSANRLKADLLALNRPTAPFIIRECTADDPENADLVAEWRMREPAWYTIFGSADLSHSFQVFMRLLEDRHEVQSIDWVWDVHWSVGVPSFSYSKTWSRGQQWEYRGSIRPFYETTPSGERVAYRFSSSELKKPLRDVVTGSGWSWRSRFAGWLPGGSRAEVLRQGQPKSARKRWIFTGAAFVVAFGVTHNLLAPIGMIATANPTLGNWRGLVITTQMVVAAVVALIVARIVFGRMSH
ncbi:MAG TPA: hypothetical protein VHC94_17930 [Nitrobacter sp.]|jgi:hypothetical protein|nr:hypothetical protein [Nitrobacter sp.]